MVYFYRQIHRGSFTSAKPDEMLYERIDAERSIYIYRNRERFFDWGAIVMYPSRSVEQLRLETVREMLESGRIQRVYLDELGAVEELPTGLGLMVLTTLEGDKAISEARGLITRAQGDSAEPTLRERGIIDTVSTIMVYKFSNLSRDEVDAMLGIELSQTRVYREAEQEGNVKGRQEEAESLILRMLKRRVGNVSIDLEAQIKALPLAQLEELGEALLDFTQMTDLVAWLNSLA
jgi:predicted transposase/invertase (TIGR01784 family)